MSTGPKGCTTTGKQRALCRQVHRVGAILREHSCTMSLAASHTNGLQRSVRCVLVYQKAFPKDAPTNTAVHRLW